MTGKWTNISRRMLFAYLMLGGLILLFTPARVTSRLQLAYANIFRVPLATGRTVALASRTAPANPAGGLGSTLSRLRNDVANLEAQLRDANDTINRLAQVRTRPEWSRMGFLPAGVITAVEAGQSELIINAGQEEGVAVDQFVMALSDHSLIGRVRAVFPHTAKVRLITDPASRIPVEIGLSGIPDVLEGRGGDSAKIPLVSTKRAVAVQDPVHALRQPGVLDAAMIVGRVAGCRQDPDNPLLWDITVRATCDIATLEDVAVVVPGR